ncbi:PKD domain-containing protein [Kaarinaea lacus]
MSSVKTGIFILCAAWVFTTHAATISKLSIAGSEEANGASINPSISADGRYVVFESDASNLVADDFNNTTDVFVADTLNNTIERVSVGFNGVEANGPSTNPVLSGDGRFVAFESFASNLVTGDSNGYIDIFVYDRTAGITTRVSVTSSGTQAGSHSFSPSISDNGQVIAFYSLATNLVTGDSNRAIDVFVHDTLSGSTERVSVDVNGIQGNMDSWQPRLSANGQYVVFSSNANNLVASDTNNIQDVFLFDRQGPSVTLVSNTDAGLPSNGRSAYSAVSGDGSYVVFESNASNLVPNDNNNATDIFVYDTNQMSLSRVSTSSSGGDTDGPSFQPAISQDGRFISFFTYASNLVASDLNNFEDVFVYDQQTGSMELLTNTEDGQPADSSSFNPVLSANGQYVAVFSFASNLVTPDTNNFDDVFLFDRGVLNSPPIANAGNDASIVLGNTVVLDGSGSFDPDGQPISSYQWQVISAPATSLLGSWSSAETTPLFAPDSVGVFVLSLIVSDGLASSTADEVFVNVSDNLPPVARIAADVAQGYAPLTVNFDGSGSYDPESGPISWAWDFGDNTNSVEVNPIHIYTVPGSYLAVLTVTDEIGNQGQAELRIEVQAVNQPPEIINLSVSPSTGPAPLLTQLSLQVMDPENDNLSIVWDLGDNTVEYDVLQFTHNYNYPGNYQGSVTVSDGVSSVQQNFVVSVDSDFSIKDTQYKIYIQHEKPQRAKFRLWSKFMFDGHLADDDIVSLQFGGLEIFQLPFSDFKLIKDGLFVYKSRQLMIKLDFDQQKIEVFKQREYITSENIKPFAGIAVHFGSDVAVGEITLVEREVCYKNKRRNQDEEYCPVTILEN